MGSREEMGGPADVRNGWALLGHTDVLRGSGRDWCAPPHTSCVSP